MSQPTQSPSSKREFRQRLGTYLLGLALGCVFMGFYWQGRSAMKARQQQAQAAAAAQTATEAQQPRSDDAEPAASTTATDPATP